MTRGSKRTYTRDANGRFASTPGGGLGAARKAARSRSGRTSTLGARTSLKRSRAKLAGKDPADQRLSTALSTRAQKAAVTRGNKGLKAAKVAARTRIQGPSMASTIAKRTPKALPQGDKAEKLKPPSRAKGSRTQLPRMDENVNLGNDKVKKKARRQGLSKKPVNKAQLTYLTAKGKARATNKDLRGADIDEKRMANSAAAVVRNMERRRSAAIPKAPPNSPLARQKERHSARWKRANRNYLNAMAQEEVAGPGSKASRSASVAKRAGQIYAGRIDPKVKTKARVSKISNFEKPRRRKPKP